jgi:Zn-dependent protease
MICGMLLLGAVDFESPLLWAVLIGWIMTVVLHEFAHGIVAHWGGDYTIRERGGLTLNPLQYVDPVMSLLLPAVFLLMGGIPLPGGSTFVRRDLLRSRAWDTAVSLAGPAMNLILFFVCALPLHPRIGWADHTVPVGQWTNGQTFLAAMAVLQLIAVMMNLVPVPPLDGFQAISPYMDDESRHKLSTPPVSTILFVGYFLVLWRVPGVFGAMLEVVSRVLIATGFGERGVAYFASSFVRALYGA